VDVGRHGWGEKVSTIIASNSDGVDVEEHRYITLLNQKWSY